MQGSRPENRQRRFHERPQCVFAAGFRGPGARASIFQGKLWPNSRDQLDTPDCRGTDQSSRTQREEKIRCRWVCCRTRCEIRFGFEQALSLGRTAKIGTKPTASPKNRRIEESVFSGWKHDSPGHFSHIRVRQSMQGDRSLRLSFFGIREASGSGPWENLMRTSVS